MSDDVEDIDPDANVPLWVNILVPIATVVLFVVVNVILWYSETEIPKQTLKSWISNTPLLSRCLSGELPDVEKESTTSTEVLLGKKHSANKYGAVF